MAGLKACFAYEQRNFYSNSVTTNRLGKPSVTTLRENFSFNHDLKRKLSIFILETGGSIYHMVQAHSVCNSSCKQMG